MTTLARRLMGVMKTINNGLPQQGWRFALYKPEDVRWTITDGGMLAALASASTSTWRLSTDAPRKAQDGAFYYEVNIIASETTNSLGLSFGFADDTRSAQNHTFAYFLTMRGTKNSGANEFGNVNMQAYMQAGTGSNSVRLWQQGDIMGASIQASGADALIHFYKNGVDLGLAFTIEGGANMNLRPNFAAQKPTLTNNVILRVDDIKHLPSGFQAW